MKESEVNNRVLQTLSMFDEIGDIDSTADWSQSLMNKIASVKQQSASGLPKTRFVVATLLILLINVGFVLNTMLNSSQKNTTHKSELQLISKELLVNPEQ
ncbi:MAG: hypothetical protein WCL51_10595 [Bacteroidota bacterium]